VVSARSEPVVLEVRGRREVHDGLDSYVLDQRLTGHDSYAVAELELRTPESVGRVVRVRVLTLDDVTTVWPVSKAPLPDRWSGTLRLRVSARGDRVPADLAHALMKAGLDPSALDASERRQLIGFVDEARPGPTREARIAAAVAAVRHSTRPK
jgi:hypothetical protein